MTLEDKTKWNSIEQSAKKYADSLAVNYDVAGAAETAKTDAISTAAIDATTKDNKVLSDSKSYVDIETNKLKQSISLCATTTYVDAQVANASAGLGGIPQYIFKGAEEVVNRIITSRNHASLVIGAMSDLHTAGTDDSATSVKHACLAMNEINKLTQLDLVAVLGDICVDHMDSVNNPGFLYVRQQLDPIDKSVDVIHLEGNHDLDEVNTSADIRRQEYYTFIGANNVDVVTDFGNEFRNYGYKDFDNKRIRVIYLNTSDVAEEGMTTHLRISPEQFTWFINTALNFSGKTGASDWQVVVLTHIPLNYTNSAISNLLQVLQDYKGKKSGSITQNGTTISYNFTNCQQTFLCHIHGHIHNYRTDWFGDVLSITVPNACFGRNNEYGTSSSYDDTVHELYGDVDKDDLRFFPTNIFITACVGLNEEFCKCLTDEIEMVIITIGGQLTGMLPRMPPAPLMISANCRVVSMGAFPLSRTMVRAMGRENFSSPYRQKISANCLSSKVATKSAAVVPL